MIRAGRLMPLAAIGRTPLTIGDQKIHPISDEFPNLPPTENFVGIYLPEGPRTTSSRPSPASGSTRSPSPRPSPSSARPAAAASLRWRRRRPARRRRR